MDIKLVDRPIPSENNMKDYFSYGYDQAEGFREVDTLLLRIAICLKTSFILRECKSSDEKLCVRRDINCLG